MFGQELDIYKANKLIDSVLNSLKKEIEFTREEFNLISSLNKDMADARNNISQSLIEYKKLNSKYSEQLKIEKQKVLDAKADVRVLYPKTIEDSISLLYQFQITNFGQRTADSIEIYSFMILLDTTNNKIKKITTLNTTLNSSNIFSLPATKDYIYTVKNIISTKEESTNYGGALLLVKYKYCDLMTNSNIEHPALIFQCNFLKASNIQYNHDVAAGTVADIKNYLRNKDHKLYKLFFEE